MPDLTQGPELEESSCHRPRQPIVLRLRLLRRRLWQARDANLGRMDRPWMNLPRCMTLANPTPNRQRVQVRNPSLEIFLPQYDRSIQAANPLVYEIPRTGQ